MDIESVEGLYELVDEKSGVILPGNCDQIREGLDWNCNKIKLQQLIKAEESELTFYCGGMANTEEVWDLFNLVVLLTVQDETTIRRLSTRTEEDRGWVLSWKHDLESRWSKMGGIRVSAEADSDKVADASIQAIQLQ